MTSGVISIVLLVLLNATSGIATLIDEAQYYERWTWDMVVLLILWFIYAIPFLLVLYNMHNPSMLKCTLNTTIAMTVIYTIFGIMFISEVSREIKEERYPCYYNYYDSTLNADYDLPETETVTETEILLRSLSAKAYG